ncbi:hypothetical protein HOD20_00545, partial [archaeon]|nr:hypothetical protein [archaeon]
KVLNDDKIVYNIIMNKDEALQLKGHTENILVLAEDAINITSRISLRGKNDATKYFLIPRELRKDIKKSKDVLCHKVDSKFKSIYVYVVDKLNL